MSDDTDYTSITAEAKTAAIEKIARSLFDVGAGHDELARLGMRAEQIQAAVLNAVSTTFGDSARQWMSARDTKPAMQLEIERLLDTEAPALTDAAGRPVANQTPAIECMVMFACGQAIRGALSTTPHGLRMLSPASENGLPVLVEQFFGYEAVTAISLIRPINGKQSNLVIPAPFIPGGRIS